MKCLKILSSFLFVPLVPFALSGCYSDPGRATKSAVEGYDQYTNKTINVSVLTPGGWHSEVGIGGVYTVTSPKLDGAQIYINRTPVVNWMKEGSSSSTTLEEFREFRLSQITVEDIGPELESSVQMSSLAGQDACEVRYSYKPAGEERKWFVREVFTLADGYVYRIQFYARDSADSETLKIFETMKHSFRILNI